MNEKLTSERDETSIRLTLEGDREAFGQLVRKYQDRLFNGMVQILRSEPEAEDVVQEAFVLALTKLESFQGKSQFYTWLYRIAYNLSITRLRRKKPTVSMEIGEDASLEFEGDLPAPGEQMMREEQAKQLMQALDRMSAEHRSILVLREMENMDYSEIADVLDLPVGTVRSRLHRARIQLRELLELTMDE